MANPAAQTAVGPMVIVAVDQYADPAARLVQDDLAATLLPTGIRQFVQLARWRPLRVWLFQVTERTATGIWGSILCRKRYIDDTLHAAIGASDAVMILGAGLDTRAYRIDALRSVPVFEVDLPANIDAKRRALEDRFGSVPAHVRLVPIDFETEDLAAVLAAHGYRRAQRTFFIWEAVTQYLTEAAVRRTFAFLATAAPGSRLVFTFVQQAFIDGRTLYDAAPTYERFRVKQEVWRFGMQPEEVAGFLAGYGWRELEQVGRDGYLQRYIGPSGRALTVSDLERIVYADKA